MPCLLGSTRGVPAGSLRLVAVGLLLLAGACVDDRRRPLRPTEDIHDPNPTRRAQAVGELGRTATPDQVPLLIESLDDEDEAVRLAAGRALVDLTGHDTGYRAYAEPAELRRQVEAWRAWYAASPAGKGPVR
jgi:HEAT repeat protein